MAADRRLDLDLIWRVMAYHLMPQRLEGTLKWPKDL